MYIYIYIYKVNVPSGFRVGRIISTFGTTRVVGRQPYAPAAFTSFSEAESTLGHMVMSEGTTKKSAVTPPGIDPGTVPLVAQFLNHYATPGPDLCI